MAKEKKAMFVPKAQEVAPIDEKYSQEDVEKAQAFVEQEEKDKGMSVVQKLNVVWTIVSTLICDSVYMHVCGKKMGGFDLYVYTHSHAGGAGDNVCSACRSNVQGQEKTENQREELQESSRYIQSVCQRVFPCDIGSVNGRYRNGRNKPCKVDCVRRNVLCRAYATSAKNNEVCNEASTQSGRQEI